jgi:hypothetical protein
MRLSIVFLLISLAFACVAATLQARPDCQQGCDLITGNTFLSDDALENNTSDLSNTVIGFNPLKLNAIGGQNRNTEATNNTANGLAALNLQHLLPFCRK